ncbi:IS21-like element helper ATPase IstB [bacterium]|nr:IS21-like element helper ATPase IstB [bacterium]RQV96723.1 MAG: AAA family ATPase [bacterium]
MNDDIEQLLNSLRLEKMHQIYDREVQRAEKNKSSYSEFFARLLRAQYHDMQNRSTKARIKRARMPEIWSLDTFPWDKQPGVDHKQIMELAEMEFIQTGTNVIFIGSTGVGKTGIASGLLLKAIQDGYRGRFIRAQDLFDEMYSSLADRSTRKLLDQLIRFEIILIDEFGYLNLRSEQTNIFFKLMEERYVQRKTTLLTTNLEYEDWKSFLNNKSLTDALLSRVRHRCTTIRINGSSLRSPSEDLSE